MPCKRRKSKLFSTISFNDEKLKWKLNSKVLCLYPSGGSNSHYEARIINIANKDGVTCYTVHYLGWNRRYDELLTEAEAEERFRVFIEGENTQQKESKKTNKLPQNILTELSWVNTSAYAAKESGSDGWSPSISLKPIQMTDSLTNILKHDCNNITELCFLWKLPARFSVRQICAKYLESAKDEFCSNIQFDCCDQFVQGIIVFFNMFLPTKLLYSFEKSQYNEFFPLSKREHMDEDNNPKKAVDIYGFAHLLRCIIELPNLLCFFFSDNNRSTKIFYDNADIFVKFLNENWEVFYDPGVDYKAASLDYMSQFDQMIKPTLFGMCK